MSLTITEKVEESSKSASLPFEIQYPFFIDSDVPINSEINLPRHT